MWQKVNPHGMRVGVIRDWDSRWYSNPNLKEPKQLQETRFGKIKLWDTHKPHNPRNFFQKSRKRKKR